MRRRRWLYRIVDFFVAIFASLAVMTMIGLCGTAMSTEFDNVYTPMAWGAAIVSGGVVAASWWLSKNLPR